MDFSLPSAQEIPQVVEAVYVFPLPLLHWIDFKGRSFAVHTLGMSFIDLTRFTQHFPLPERCEEGYGGKLYRPLFEFIDGGPEGSLDTLIESSLFWHAFEVGNAPHLLAVSHVVVLQNRPSEFSDTTIFEHLDTSMAKFALSLKSPCVELQSPPQVLFTRQQIQRLLSPSATALLS